MTPNLPPSSLRFLTPEDLSGLHQLYYAVAQQGNGIIRFPEEITEDYIRGFIDKSRKTGLGLVIEEDGQIVGNIHAYMDSIKVFRHVLLGLTIVVHPEHQGKGIGRRLFTRFLELVERGRPDILRVELFVREINKKALNFYEKLGFVREGVLRDELYMLDGSFHTPIAMAWRNPNFRKSAIAMDAKHHKVAIAPAEQKDLPALSVLAKKIYAQHFTYLWKDGSDSYREKALSVEQIAAEIQLEGVQWYKAFWQGQAVGFLKVHDAYGPSGNDINWFKLERIYLLREVQGTGIGQAMMTFAIQQAKVRQRQKIWLEAMDSSTGAIAFYRKNGFEVFAESRMDAPLIKEGLERMYRFSREL